MLLVTCVDDVCLIALVCHCKNHRLKLTTGNATVCWHNNRNNYIAQLEVFQSKPLSTFYTCIDVTSVQIPNWMCIWKLRSECVPGSLSVHGARCVRMGEWRENVSKAGRQVDDHDS